jgi:broad specificity phosphatase PhoE
MHIYLVRHAKYHNPDNIFPFHLPVHLSREGREHVHRVGKWFVTQGLLELPIFTSPIARCVQTAEIVASHTNSYVACDTRLIETSSPRLQGVVQPAVDAWKTELTDTSRETQDSVRKRAVAFFEEKVNEQTDCILVSHGDPITILYFHLLGKKLPEELITLKVSIAY